MLRNKFNLLNRIKKFSAHIPLLLSTFLTILTIVLHDILKSIKSLSVTPSVKEVHIYHIVFDLAYSISYLMIIFGIIVFIINIIPIMFDESNYSYSNFDNMLILYVICGVICTLILNF